jgi:hypothetical protein
MTLVSFAAILRKRASEATAHNPRYFSPGAPYVNLMLVTFLLLGAAMYILAQFYGVIGLIQSAPDNGGMSLISSPFTSNLILSLSLLYHYALLTTSTRSLRRKRLHRLHEHGYLHYWRHQPRALDPRQGTHHLRHPSMAERGVRRRCRRSSVEASTDVHEDLVRVCNGSEVCDDTTPCEV